LYRKLGACQPGSAMHIHQSVIDLNTNNNIFTNTDGSASPLFFQYIAGLQKYIPKAMPLFAPYVNSYRRLTRNMSAPINVSWGFDNRTCGIRIPNSSPEARRIENRVPGVDVNPYLALATTLACGYLGITEGLSPSEPIADNAWETDPDFPRNLEYALRRMQNCDELSDLLGKQFLNAYWAVKSLEHATYKRVISSWEREYLQQHV
jgi:glutamine synthetase